MLNFISKLFKKNSEPTFVDYYKKYLEEGMNKDEAFKQAELAVTMQSYLKEMGINVKK